MAIEKVQAGQEIKAAKINEIIDEVETIELTPGPKGDAGATGPKGATGAKGDPGVGVKTIAFETDEAGAITGGTATLTDDSTIAITIT